MAHRTPVWDLPTRIFHWSLATLVAGAIISGKIGGNAIVWHGRIGLALVGLVVFRLAWGFLGSTHARFASFVPTPSRLRAYLRGEWDGLGHNPLGALSVLALLALIGAQLATGLLANDDIAFQGHLAPLVAKELSDTLSSLHRLLINGLIGLIALHLAAIMFYAHVKRENLVKPMLTGWKETAAAPKTPVGGGPLALLVALLLACAAIYAGSGSWIAPPPVAAAAPTPSF
ncbi:cytochrome b/b6 domain-containing protein [Propionivibrio dicarboxylicus]|uniref:Cytochrome b n=1 Tax=Propionivibrio dicarboxylicus TaxID=83767 RepID=A0A1G8BPM3_9RHOO|nr:cytochrome b/b6 domain-containing protein [Propionivibrio dicarboxylicus]SDH35109.1 Cytochrome b [Propionivibrio dicarboxylicus]